MPALWRVTKRVHAATAFDGKAAARLGGRWNSPGQGVVYASGTKSLALLEILVHLDVGTPLPRLVAFAFTVDDRLVERVRTADLPRQWRTSHGLAALQRISDNWLTAGRSLALAVPSVVVPEEWNYVLNPLHPAFARLKPGRAVPFLLDPRLARA